MATEPKRIKMPQLIRQRPQLGAIISKLNRSNKEQKIKPERLNIPQVGKSIQDRIKNNEDIMQLFPDIEVCIRIVVSSILSPNDMNGNNLTYTPPDIRLPSGVKQTITSTIQDYIDTNYHLEDNLYDICREALFLKGAYVEAIIPEASVDDAVNGWINKTKITVENYLASLDTKAYDFIAREPIKLNETLKFKTDIAGPKPQFVEAKIEIEQEDLNIDITDNYNLLNLNKVMVEEATRINRTKLGFEFNTAKEDSELDSIFKINDTAKQEEVVTITIKDDASRKSLGKPMVMKLPADSVIPVHLTNDPSKHLGYYVILDNNGMPLTVSNELDKLMNEDAYRYNSSEGSTQFNLIRKAKNSLVNLTRKDTKLDNLEELYNQLVEKMIKDKIKKGTLGELADINVNSDIYKCMFLRAMKAQKTRILFLPSELVTYYAFEYRDNGTGKSLLEKANILFSVRAILLFTRMMAMLKNSVTVTKVDAKLDDDDPDPEATMSDIISIAMKTRQTQLPFGISNVDDLVEWAHGVGFRFNFKSTGLPDMDITYSDETPSKTVPDDQLDENIRKFIYMSFGLTAEMVDAAYQVDYATTLVSNNLLFAKFVRQKQQIFIPMIKRHIKTIIYNDMDLQDAVKEVIKSNMKEIKANIKDEVKNQMIDFEKYNDETITRYIITRFANDMEVTLAEPEVHQANPLDHALEAYMQELDKYLDAVLSDQAIIEKFAGKLNMTMNDIKVAARAMFIKRWMAENNYLPEINEFFTKDIDGKPLFDPLMDYNTYIEQLLEVVIPFFKDNEKLKNKIEKQMAKFEDMAEPSSVGSSDSGDMGGAEDTGGDGMGDDMGMDMDMDMDDESGEGENTEGEGEGDTGEGDEGSSESNEGGEGGSEASGDTGGSESGGDTGGEGEGNSGGGM